MFPFEKILGYISNEQCALILGPEIMRFDGKPMNMYIRDRLNAQFATDVSHYYPKDGFFLFPADDPSVKSDVQQALRNECHLLPQAPGFDEALLKTIARLPFHLIVTTSPDTFLSDTFYKYGVTHRFSWFRKGDRPSADVAPPTAAEPLIYNLAGSILEDESLVLDYEDLFSLIGSSMGAAGLPAGLRTALEKIQTFVFVGFAFDKWYTQVMLRILFGKTPTFRKFAGPHSIQPETQVFLANQFKINFWKPEAGDFLGSFMENAGKFVDINPQRAGRPFLRQLSEKPLAPVETNIIREIRNGRYDKAIELLLAFAQGTPFENEVSLTSGRYNHLAQNQSKMDSRDFLTTLNQVVDAMISLARQVAASV